MAKTKVKFGYSIINKETNQVVGEEGEAIFKSEKEAYGDAENFLIMGIIPNEFPDKTLKDFEIVVEEIIK